MIKKNERGKIVAAPAPISRPQYTKWGYNADRLSFGKRKDTTVGRADSH